ncbi:hypothetical protein, partial [Escherichia coli]|uniref:hypothetical protein n=1 Tax=Escherichia coli TaxID=562 RepID=UPI001BC8BA64
MEMVFVWKQNYILVDEYFFFCCTWIVNSADKKSVISCVSDNKHSFKTFRNNQNTGIPLVNIFTYEMNKYWN